MSKIVFVVGGARSGKSCFAETRALSMEGARHVYVATAEAFDAEMADRILCHQLARSDEWDTVEAPSDLAETLTALKGSGAVILVDCLTLWLSNRLLAGGDIQADCERLLSVLETIKEPVVLVANEVGLSIVPDNELARKFRDAAGLLNQRVAKLASEVNFMVAGLPMRLK